LAKVSGFYLYWFELPGLFQVLLMLPVETVERSTSATSSSRRLVHLFLTHDLVRQTHHRSLL